MADQLLARIPQLQRLLQTPRAQALAQRFEREATVRELRAQLQKVRAALRAGTGEAVPDFFSQEFFAEVELALRQRRRAGPARVINGTGVILHTNLGRAPLATQAREAIDAASGYAALELDLVSGDRGVRHAAVRDRLCRLTGAQDAIVVNNGAAAVMLMLAALARDGQVIVSRGELIEIGGGFRIPDVIAQSGARLVEVGTTNRTRIEDYAAAIGEATRMVLACHPSNYRIVGFTCRPERAELAALAAQRGLVFAEDLGSGALIDPARFGLPPEPTVADCVRCGADLVSFSGDKLLGGPQAGIIVGRHALIAQLERHPLMRALRCDKLSLAALDSTLALYDSETLALRTIPVLKMLSEEASAVRRRAHRLARALRRLPRLQVRVAPASAVAGGGALPGASLPSTQVLLRIAELSSDELARRARLATPALFGRVTDGDFAIDLRTIRNDEVREIVRLIEAVLA